MTIGVLVFEGMRVGVLPGDFKIEIAEDGTIDGKLILSTAYNVLPIWLRVAHDQVLQSRRAYENLKRDWGASEPANKELLISELEPSLQVFVACGIALDALYDQLRPFAKLTDEDRQRWRENRTGRGKQILEVIRRVYRLDAEYTTKFSTHISEIIELRDKAVHPSLELKQACTRHDLPCGVDWKFSAYRCSNAENCFHATMAMLIHIFEKKSGIAEIDTQMEHVFAALEELRVITRKSQGRAGTSD